MGRLIKDPARGHLRRRMAGRAGREGIDGYPYVEPLPTTTTEYTTNAILVRIHAGTTEATLRRRGGGLGGFRKCNGGAS
jgi:hypothetical protein